MLIKPLIDKAKESIKSLPSKSEDTQAFHPAYFGTPSEHKEYLEFEGRLLMLPIMYEEWNIKQNKIIHDTNGTCIKTWPLCECKHARSIRMKDIGGTNWKLEW